MGKLKTWNKNLFWATYFLMKTVLNILLKKACLEVADGWKRQLVFPEAEVVEATCVAGGQWACSWWLLWVHQFATVITAAGDPFLYPALCKQQLITTKHQLLWSSIRSGSQRAACWKLLSVCLQTCQYLLSEAPLLPSWSMTALPLLHSVALSSSINIRRWWVTRLAW